MPSHNNNNIGALGSLSQEAFGSLKGGFDLTNPAFTLGPVNVSRGQAINTALGFTPIGPLSTMANAAISYNAEKAAQQALGQNVGLLDTVTGMFSNPALDTARGLADTNKDGKVSNTEAQNFGMNRGLTAYDVNLNPMQGYTPNTIKTTDITNVDPTGLGVTNEAVGSTGDLGGATDVGYKGSTGGFLGFGKTEGVGESGPTGLGDTEQTGDQTSITDTSKGKDLSNTFADDAGASSGDDGTYICTALYDMGDMKQYIYEYDQRYGKLVNPAVYRGYELWGKFLAKQIRKKGLTYKITKPLALAWAYQMAYDLSKGKKGKNSKPVKILKTIGEGVCYVLGQIFKRRFKWQKST
jgi:hypothetical protein